MKYGVVIVNWNGADDSVACLESFLPTSPDAVAIVVDNGSTDASLARIGAALAALNAAPWRAIGRGTPPGTEAPPAGCRAVLVEAGENLGFAAGCNLGLRFAQAAGLATTVFLNNDTLAEPQALDRLVQRLATGDDCFACLPMLTVHATGRIWNCGGEVYRLGLRRYHLGGRPRGEGATRGEIACSFFTGCCFAVRTAGFVARGGFSERFFFGEEDFELALWMKDRGLGAVCLTSAVVAHKVGASFDRASDAQQNRKVFVYYLNRFIHMRLRLGPAVWRAWVAAYLPYTVILLLRRRVVGPAALPGFLRHLLRRARAMDGVSRADFEAVMRGPWPP